MEKDFIAEHTSNGYCYKNANIFLNYRDEICYIAECDFDDNGVMENGEWVLHLTDEKIPNLVAFGGADTHNSICKLVREMCAENNLPIIDNFVEYLACCAFGVCDWQCISTYLYELDIDQEYADWCTERKNKFETYAINNVRDEGSGELLDEAYHDELLTSLYECLGEDCYLYDNPNNLIDRWEK